MNHLESIEEGLKAKRPHIEIVRKVYLTYPTHAFVDREEKQFEILNNISEYFHVPINNVQVIGSSKTGYSFHKKKKFNSLTSDLDIAIIDSILFQKYTEWVFRTTNGFTDFTSFIRDNGKSTYNEYIKYVSKGFFRPDLMPSGLKSAEWREFFGDLSSKNKTLFKSINAGIYFSQTFFEFKQTSNIETYSLNLPL